MASSIMRAVLHNLSRSGSQHLSLKKSLNTPRIRLATTSSTGEVLPMPPRTKFGLVGVVCAVVPGLLIGATISKKMANFLEETELFIPSDDDDDDDD